MSQSKAPPARARRVVEARKALLLRSRGYKYWQIGEALGHTESWAHDTVTKELARQIERLAEPAEAVRQLELQILWDWLQTLEPRLVEGDLEAMETGLKILDRIAKLEGLYKSDKISEEMSEGLRALVAIWADQQRSEMRVPRQSLASYAEAIDAEVDGHEPIGPAPLAERNGDAPVYDYSSLDEANWISDPDYDNSEG